MVCLLVGAHRFLDQQHVERPVRAIRAGLAELRDAEVGAKVEQQRPEPQQRELAAVAGGELDHADRECSVTARGGGDRGFGGHQMPSSSNASPSSARENTGPSLHTKKRPIWQCPQSPTPHSMWRSMDR